MKSFLFGVLLGISLMAIPVFSRDFLGPDGEIYYEIGPTMIEKEIMFPHGPTLKESPKEEPYVPSRWSGPKRDPLPC